MGMVLFLFILVVFFTISAGGSFYYLKEKFAFDSAFIADIEARRGKAEALGRKKSSSRLYRERSQEVEDEAETVVRKDALLVTAEDIIRKYVNPHDVRLLDLYMDKEGIIYADFGDELRRNVHVDAREELEIVAGLYNSLRTTIPGFTALKILIGGKEAESLGGHIDISKPIGEEIASSI